MKQSSRETVKVKKAPKRRKQVHRPRVMRRTIRRRDALEAAQRLHSNPDGSVTIVRFTRAQRLQHVVLIVAFTGLAISGLSQSFYKSSAGSFVINLLGGIEATRSVHHLFAVLAVFLFAYHVGAFIYDLFVLQRENGMGFGTQDWRDLIGMLKLNLGGSKRQPRFDRYNVEQKIDYWVLIISAVILGISGVMQWFPVWFSQWLPGWTIPVARAFHYWEAVFIVLFVLTWHLYHAVLKTRNVSIFSGVMSKEQMLAEHPLEQQYLEAAAAAVNNESWPIEFEVQIEEAQVEKVIPLKKESERSDDNAETTA